MTTADDLVSEYKELTKNCFNVNYGDKKALKRNNDSVKRMYEIVQEIRDDHGQDGISKLKPLLDIDEYQTNLWIAAQLLEKVDLDEETEKKALSIIKRIASSSEPAAIGFQFWLQDWNEKREK